MTKHKHRGADVPAFGRQPDQQTVILPPTPPPKESWWCGLPPDRFYARLRQERERIASSTFGRGKKLITNPVGVSR